MCRSIKTLRPPAISEEATEEEIRAAALQYVRKVSGFRAPAAHNREVFDRAVAAVAAATAELLDDLEVRGAAPPARRRIARPQPRTARGPRLRAATRRPPSVRVARGPCARSVVPYVWSGVRTRSRGSAPAVHPWSVVRSPRAAAAQTPVACSRTAGRRTR